VRRFLLGYLAPLLPNEPTGPFSEHFDTQSDGYRGILCNSKDNQKKMYAYLTIAAIVLGPVLALLAQRALDFLREKGERQKKLYFTLMGTRALFNQQEHVQALNSIDVIFSKDGNIRDLWRRCLDHLATDEVNPGWLDTLDTLRVDLYQAIGNKLGYHYTTEYIKRGIYFPKYHSNLVTNQNKLLEGFAKAVESGKLKVEVVETPPAEEIHIAPPRIGHPHG
jgi:hypothetical protein